MNTKTILAIGMTSAMMLTFNACQQNSHENPLLAESSLPFGAPDFSKIQTSDYLPAFEAAMQQTRDNIQAIVDCKDSATFENTILPFEDSSRQLTRVSTVFFALTEADKSDELSEIEKKVQPMLTDLQNEISFNKPLFQRIKQVRQATGLDVSSIALAYLTCQPFPTFALAGASRAEHITALEKAGNATLSASQLKDLRSF